jgi:hypothetical protein
LYVICPLLPILFSKKVFLITGLTLDTLTRIYSYDELKERARKAFELNGFETPEYDPKFDPMLRAA